MSCISRSITDGMHVMCWNHVFDNWINKLFAVSILNILYKHLHGLIFDTSIWLLAGSTRFCGFEAIRIHPKICETHFRYELHHRSSFEKTNDRFDCEAFSRHSWTCMNNIGTQATLVVHTISHIVSIHIDDYVYSTAFSAISYICAHELIRKFTMFTTTFHDAQFETPTKLFQLLPA